MRERFVYRGDSLWWFTELYLQKMRQLDRAVLTVLALDAARAQHAPARIVVDGADAATPRLRGPLCRARHTWTCRAAPAPPGLGGRAGRRERRLSRAQRDRAGRRRLAPAPIAAFVHTAFWRRSTGAGHEGYIGPVLDALDQTAPGEVRLVGVGPRRTFSARSIWNAAAGAMAGDTPAPAITPVEDLRWASARLAGALAPRAAERPVSGPDPPGRRHSRLRPVDGAGSPSGRGRVQWPWSARAMDEAARPSTRSAATRSSPTPKQAAGPGAGPEARRRGAVAWACNTGSSTGTGSTTSTPDEFQPAGPRRATRIPRADLTLVFDCYAETHLRSAGHSCRPSRGHRQRAARRALARVAACSDADRMAAREAGGAVQPGQKLAVLTAKFTEVRDVLPALMEAIRRRPDIHLAIKAHPAEVGAVYLPCITGLPNVSIVPADADLARLLAAADAVVTRTHRGA
jgi:hypothetical protein